jgi:ATP-binding cassette subfamily B protein
MLQLIVLLLLVDTFAAAVFSLAIRSTVDAALDADTSQALISGIIGGAAAGIMGAVGRVNGNLQEWIALVTGAELTSEALGTAAKLPGIEHLERPEYLDKVVLLRQSGPDLLRSVFAVAGLASFVARILLGTVLLATVNPFLAPFPLFVLPNFLLAGRARRSVDDAADRSAATRRMASSLHSAFLDSAGREQIQVGGAVADFEEQADRLWRDVASIRLRGAMREAAKSAMGWSLLGLGYGGSLAVVALDARSGTATAGELVMVTQLIVQVRGDLSRGASGLREALAVRALVDRFLWLDDYARTRLARYEQATAPSPAITTSIELHNVTFAYPGHTRPALHDVTMTLPAGKSVAIVGVNGSGKTTLTKLLCGLYEPDEGTIVIDDMPLTTISLSSWRRSITATMQDFLRLETTVRTGIATGDLLRDDEEALQRAAERGGVNLLVQRLPDGLDTLVGSIAPGSQPLSGGEWQRIAASRGMLRSDHARLYLLDEPTAALDPGAEHALYSQYLQTSESLRRDGGVTLFVSHRLGSIRDVDLIYLMADGRVLESGSHDELMSQPTQYRETFLRQAAAYR